MVKLSKCLISGYSYEIAIMSDREFSAWFLYNLKKKHLIPMAAWRRVAELKSPYLECTRKAFYLGHGKKDSRKAA